MPKQTNGTKNEVQNLIKIMVPRFFETGKNCLGDVLISSDQRRLNHWKHSSKSPWRPPPYQHFHASTHSPATQAIK